MLTELPVRTHFSHRASVPAFRWIAVFSYTAQPSLVFGRYAGLLFLVTLPRLSLVFGLFGRFFFSFLIFFSYTTQPFACVKAFRWIVVFS